MKKSIVNKNGIVYNVECDDIVIETQLNYNQLVSELIRKKYSLDDELSLNSKSMQMFLNNCTEDQRKKWMEEIKEFTNYREQCIAKAKVI